MKKIGLPLAIVVLLAGLFIAWSYLTTENNVGAIEGRLPSEEQLNAMSPDALAAIKSDAHERLHEGRGHGQAIRSPVTCAATPSRASASAAT